VTIPGAVQNNQTIYAKIIWQSTNNLIDINGEWYNSMIQFLKIDIELQYQLLSPC